MDFQHIGGNLNIIIIIYLQIVLEKMMILIIPINIGNMDSYI